MRRFRYDARRDRLKCPRGKILKPGRAIKHGRFFTCRASDCRWCDLAQLCLSKGRVNKAVVVGADYPALLRARRRREYWSDEDRRLYQRHRWRSEGYHREAKSWHGLSRAVRRGLSNMKIQAYLTAAAVNLRGKRHKTENTFVSLKDWRRIHTRCDCCAYTFMSAIAITATVIFWL